jgi:threonine aldolase
MIDLRSDTLTKPTEDMLKVMINAKVGDDVWGEDPSVQQLETFAANLFTTEAALFCPSGTMTNQIAIKVHTNPGDEVICDRLSHIYNFEGGGIAFHSGASVRLIEGDRGRINAADIPASINPDNIHFPISRLLSVENTVNRGGGSYYQFDDLLAIEKVCRENKLALHLDGARLFNALVETPETPAQYGALFDSISICLSKGLGAPVGSLLLGSGEFIEKARRIRKLMGGGMRQAGYMAAAGLYALQNNIGRLKQDHIRVKKLEAVIKNQSFVSEVMPAYTNILIFKLRENIEEQGFIDYFQQRGILLHAIGKNSIRIVTHLNFDDSMLEKLCSEIERAQL